MEKTSIAEVVNKAGEQVTVSGWVHARRDHGKIIFIDLRDYTGLLQVVFAPDSPEAHKLANEFVSSVRPYHSHLFKSFSLIPFGTISNPPGSIT